MQFSKEREELINRYFFTIVGVSFAVIGIQMMLVSYDLGQIGMTLVIAGTFLCIFDFPDNREDYWARVNMKK